MPRADRPSPGGGPGRIAWGAIGIAALIALGALGARRFGRDAEASGFGWIEPARLRLLPPAVVHGEDGAAREPWVDPRWEVEAARRLAVLPPFRADDAETRLAVARAVAGLSFVELAAEPEVIWPDGLRVPVRLRRPVACVAAAGAFRAVDGGGVLLSGRWDAPPRRDGGWLPLVRPDLGRLERVEEDLGSGLAVARSYWLHVPEDERERFGRFVVDVTLARSGDWRSGGVRLVFEDGRIALFGRPPDGAAPGELPAERKWRSLREALALRPPVGEVDWEIVDVRWDRPELRLRDGGERGVEAR